MSIKYSFLITCLIISSLPAQNQTPINKKDTTDIYNKIKIYSKRSKFTQTIHGLIFKSTQKRNEKRIHENPNESYKPYQGKPIRNIYIETLDPFGFSVEDTTKGPKNWMDRFGNAVHIKSKNFAIRNLLLFKQNTPLDTLLLYESQRLIRSQNFVRSVKIEAEKSNQTSDSVDIKVRVLDSWSIIPKASISTSKTNILLNERNFFGLGHEFKNGIEKSFNNKNTGYQLEYIIPTIKNSYIRTDIKYHIDLEGFYQKKLNIERTFFSPLTKWAGGLYLDEQFHQDSLPNVQNEFNYQNFKYRTNDIWAGHAFRILDGQSIAERTTNLITSLRYINVEYRESPNKEYDSINYFSNENFYLGSIGITSRQFIEDNYIFRDGIIEDVPVGFSGSLTPGYQRKNQENRYYLGANITVADYSKWGYLSGSIGYETFFHHSKLEQSALNIEFNYFTDLITLGAQWKMRQFIKPQLLLGFNRLNTIGDRLSLDGNMETIGYDRNNYRRNNSRGIPGFDADIYGTQKILFTMQTQFYSPWNLLGFRLNPYVNFTAGLIGDTYTPLSKSKMYSSIGAGFIIRNDFLVFSSFQLSLSYYPTIPGQGNNIFKTNSFETDDLGFQSINMGKPSTLLYP
ncbi:hypothetical protein [Confluentibacter sediminis]|uniref:hypothetical protein n=1 Tax=Confluentibacter sediminis TaxID=2219045 RepID=UPI001F1FF228|nr:hypothetical protein [Confluentibacter sediminis]